jgi:cysteinyl-tRNA synthetase
MVHHEGEKMSKSLGNLVMVRDLLEQWSPDSLRLYLSGHHYRETWSYSVDELAQADRLARRLLAAATVAGGTGAPVDPAPAVRAFSAAMDDDLDSAAALAAVAGLAAEISGGAREGRDVRQAQEEIRRAGRVFGLQLDTGAPDPDVVAGWSAHLQRFI